MRRVSSVAVGLAVVSLAAFAQNQTGKPLDIYVIDCEGGHATLYVAPNGETLLEDTGNPGGRDTDRIMEAIGAAGVKQIDHLILTHYHVDHVGGLADLAKRIPIKHYIDHGPTTEPQEQVANFQKTYAELYSQAKHTVVKPGDKLTLGPVDVTVVTSAGQVIKKPLPGGGQPNPACSEFQPRDESAVQEENRQSVGVVYTYGKFRHINLGDFTWNLEKELMCPNNPIGKVDLYLTSHHGIEQSGSPALVHGLRPEVAIMHNSSRKGGVVQTMNMLWTSPGLQNVWQLHWAYAAGLDYNAPELFIANLEDPAAISATLGSAGDTANSQGRGPGAVAGGAGVPAGGPGAARGRGMGGFGRGGHNSGPAYYIKVSANADGSFTVTNSRNNFSKTYNAR